MTRQTRRRLTRQDQLAEGLASIVKMEARFRMSNFLPDTHVAVKASFHGNGRNGTTRFEIYHGAAFFDNWIGDILYIETEVTSPNGRGIITQGIWESHPRHGQHKTYEFPSNAALELLRAEEAHNQDPHKGQPQ